MNTIKEIIFFALSGFWRFCGFVTILSLVLHVPARFILDIVHKNIRAKTIRQKGYPPMWCDGDGDFRKMKKYFADDKDKDVAERK